MGWVVGWLRARSHWKGSECCFSVRRVPAAHLGDFLEMQQPFALALSCSVRTALVGAARSVGVARELGSRWSVATALPTADSRVTVGYRCAGPCSRRRRADPAVVGTVPTGPAGGRAGPDPRTAALVRLSHALVAGAIDATTRSPGTTAGLVEELQRVLQVLESSLLLQEPVLVAEHVQWLHETGPVHGSPRTSIGRSSHSPMRWTVISSGPALH